MKKNNKRMLVAVLAMAMALSMTACSEEPAEDTSSSEPESSVSEQVSEPEVSDLEVEEDTNSETEDETSEPDDEGADSSSAADASSSTASQPAADTASQPAADQGSSQAQQPATSSQANTSSQAQNQSTSTPPATTQTSNASSGKGPLAKYAVNVQDSSTPATSVVGETLNGKSAYYFYSADGKLLGSIPIDYLMQIIGDNGLSYAEDDEQKAWFVESFNIYRGLEGGSNSSGSSSPSSSSGSTGSSSSEIDIESLRDELIRLTNEEREDAGLESLTVDDELMDFAQIRAEEISELYSHNRPSGAPDGPYAEYQYGENIAKGYTTPQAAVDGWMGSDAHRAEIMDDTYNDSFGVGVYRAPNGTYYWVQVFIGDYSRA